MKADCIIYLTRGGDLTSDRNKGAFIFKSLGKDITPLEIKKYPALKNFIPELREAKEEEVMEKQEEPSLKRIIEPENKMVKKAPNKRGGKNK